MNKKEAVKAFYADGVRVWGLLPVMTFLKRKLH